MTGCKPVLQKTSPSIAQDRCQRRGNGVYLMVVVFEDEGCVPLALPVLSRKLQG